MATSDLLSCIMSTVCCRRTVRSFTSILLQRRTMMMLLISLCILTRHQAYGVITITSPAQREVTVSLGQTLSIQCVSDEGTPVKWSYGGQILEDEDAIRTHTDTSGRLISTLTLLDINEEGKYICSNPDDFYDRAEVNVNVYASAPPQTVQIVEPDGDELRTPTGEQFTLRCVGEEGSSIRWLHNDNPIRSMGTRVVITTSLDVDDHKIKSLLTRLNATPQEAGHYTCQDENQPMSSDTVRVTLYGAREDSIPVELVQPRSSQLGVDLDASFTLTCRGDTRASLTWYINNTLISLLNAPVQITMREADGPAKMTMLSVEKAAYSDSGMYTCRNGKDLNDKDEVTVRVRHPGEQQEDDVVEEPEVAPTELRREILRVGSPMKLQCSLEALADHVTEWYKDDRKLRSDGNKYVIKNTGAAELYIQNTDWMDAGVYRCTFLYRDTGVVIANILFNLTTIPCVPLAPPQNGSFVTCPEDPMYGDFCTFRCHKGYRLTDKRPVICETYDGSGAYVWNRATPKCIGMTPDDLVDSVPTSLSHVLLRVGSSLKLQCQSGSSWMKGSERLVNGDKYTIEEHALIIKHTGKGDTGIYDCNVVREDYTLKGIKKFNVTTLPCPKLPPLSNGSIDSCSREPAYGETCHFRCFPGYKLTGSRSQVCELAHNQFRSYWTGNEKPLCVRDIRSSASGHTSCASHSLFSRTLTVVAVQLAVWLSLQGQLH